MYIHMAVMFNFFILKQFQVIRYGTHGCSITPLVFA